MCLFHHEIVLCNKIIKIWCGYLKINAGGDRKQLSNLILMVIAGEYLLLLAAGKGATTLVGLTGNEVFWISDGGKASSFILVCHHQGLLCYCYTPVEGNPCHHSLQHGRRTSCGVVTE